MFVPRRWRFKPTSGLECRRLRWTKSDSHSRRVLQTAATLRKFKHWGATNNKQQQRATAIDIAHKKFDNIGLERGGGCEICGHISNEKCFLDIDWHTQTVKGKVYIWHPKQIILRAIDAYGHEPFFYKWRRRLIKINKGIFFPSC